ncbi:MAG: molecular chaperone DnaJ [Coriobacteriales bacterium]
MASIDYYEVLGVSRNASPDEIKKAFRRKARETHPDVSQGENAEEEFKRINEAYEVLSDAEKRAMYDRYGTAEPRATGFGGGGFGDFGDLFGVGDIFETFFGGGGFGGAQRARVDGRDMHIQATVTLLEAATGVEKDLTFTRTGPCPACHGSGAAPGGTVTTCPDCRGTGQKRYARRTILGTMESLMPCDRCGSTGTVAEPPCPDCRGTGQAQVNETVRVSIPAGVADGQALPVPGYGEAGVRGARSGDLIVVVRVQPHEYLHREGDDLHAQAVINIAQASLGATLKVPGLFGDEEISFGGGAQTGDVVRLKGRGMPRARGGAGDFIVHLRVEVPKKLTKRQRELVRELGESFGTGSGAPTPLERLKDWLGG